MHTVFTVDPITHPELPGVTVIPLGDTPEVGKTQQVYVRVDPHCSIPLHTHRVDAHMRIVEGSGMLLSQCELHGTTVSTGNVVFFKAEGSHGFEAGPDGLGFISTNGGIVSAHGDWDMTLNN